MTGLLFVTIGLFVFVCVVLILLVLIQKGRGGGLSNAFGGGGGNTAFGSKTGDVLTWATSIVFGIFLLLAIALSLTAESVNADKYPSAKQQPPRVNAPGGGPPLTAGSSAPVAPTTTPVAAPAPAAPVPTAPAPTAPVPAGPTSAAPTTQPK